MSEPRPFKEPFVRGEPISTTPTGRFKIYVADLERQLAEAQRALKAARHVLEMDDPRLLKCVQTIDRVLGERNEAQGKLDAAKKRVVGQKGTLHKVTGKWNTSKREGERLAAALAHLLAWIQPSSSQQVEAEVETAIEELEQYRKAHPRFDRTLPKERE